MVFDRLDDPARYLVRYRLARMIICRGIVKRIWILCTGVTREFHGQVSQMREGDIQDIIIIIIHSPSLSSVTHTPSDGRHAGSETIFRGDRMLSEEPRVSVYHTISPSS
jgi:hypothetical protein